jgi:glutamate--cysteine ligase
MSPSGVTVDSVVGRCAAAFRPAVRTQIGAEVEWLVYDRRDRSVAVAAATTERVAAGVLPAGGRVTVEPGGQLELSTLPFPGPGELVAAVEADARVLIERFDAAALELVPLGLDPIRSPLRSLNVERYAAMESYFARYTPPGVDMMTRTAALQLNVDVGPDPAETWRRAHVMIPLLAATFANSPTTDGSSFAPVSHRQQIWSATDPSRTRPVGPEMSDWSRYVLDAFVMLRLDGDGSAVVTEHRRTLREHLASGDTLSVDEVELHLTTMFPPVRPRGHLEFRMLDSVPATGRAAAIAVVWTLLTDVLVSDELLAIPASVADAHTVAIERGLDDATLRRAAIDVLDLVASRWVIECPDLAEACRLWRERVESRLLGTSVAELLVPERLD